MSLTLVDRLSLMPLQVRYLEAEAAYQAAWDDAHSDGVYRPELTIEAFQKTDKACRSLRAAELALIDKGAATLEDIRNWHDGWTTGMTNPVMCPVDIS